MNTAPPQFRHKGLVRLAAVQRVTLCHLSAADARLSASHVHHAKQSDAPSLDAAHSPSCLISPPYLSPAVAVSPATEHNGK